MTVGIDLIGARLDAAVEMAVFDRDAYACNDGTGDWLVRGRDGEDYVIPRYSESLDETWKVVHEMRKRGYRFTLSDAGGDGWFCSFAQPPTRPSSSARAEMVTWAICWAALKAID
jgi:hypothetical protein